MKIRVNNTKGKQYPVLAISNKVVKRLGLNVYESNVQLKTATDEVTMVLGETEDIDGSYLQNVLLGLRHGRL